MQIIYWMINSLFGKWNLSKCGVYMGKCLMRRQGPPLHCHLAMTTVPLRGTVSLSLWKLSFPLITQNSVSRDIKVQWLKGPPFCKMCPWVSVVTEVLRSFQDQRLNNKSQHPLCHELGLLKLVIYVQWVPWSLSVRSTVTLGKQGARIMHLWSRGVATLHQVHECPYTWGDSGSCYRQVFAEIGEWGQLLLSVTCFVSKTSKRY